MSIVASCLRRMNRCSTTTAWRWITSASGRRLPGRRVCHLQPVSRNAPAVACGQRNVPSGTAARRSDRARFVGLVFRLLPLSDEEKTAACRFMPPGAASISNGRAATCCNMRAAICRRYWRLSPSWIITSLENKTRHPARCCGRCYKSHVRIKMRIALFDLDNAPCWPATATWNVRPFLIGRGILDAESTARENDRFLSTIGRHPRHPGVPGVSAQSWARSNDAELDKLHHEYMRQHIVPLITDKARALVKQHQGCQ